MPFHDSLKHVAISTPRITYYFRELRLPELNLHNLTIRIESVLTGCLIATKIN